MSNFDGGRVRGKGARRAAFAAALAAILLAPSALVWGQAGLPQSPAEFPFTFNGPQAGTPEELDAFGLVTEASQPSDIIARVEAFARKFPQSQFLSLAQLREMQAEIEVNSYEGAVAVGHAVLRKSPNNLEALILLAGVLPNFRPSCPDSRKAEALKEAAGDIQSAGQLLQTFRLTEGYPPRVFLAEKQKLRVSLQEAAAFVDLVSGKYEQAIQEYEAVLAASRTQPASTCFRLGVAYYHTGQMEKARAQLEAARQSDTGIIRQQATSLLKQIAAQPVGAHPSPTADANGSPRGRLPR